MPESMHPNAQADGPTGPHPEPGPMPEERVAAVIFTTQNRVVDPAKVAQREPWKTWAAEIRAAEQAAREDERRKIAEDMIRDVDMHRKAARRKALEEIAAWLLTHPQTPNNRNRDECLADQIRARAEEEAC